MSIDDQKEITEEQLQALYMFISMNYESFTPHELEHWKIILEKIDPEFNNESED
jgi:hypothetical protein